MTEPILVSTSTASLENARAIAQALVEERLAACVHVSPIESFYLWQGAVHHDPEHAVRIKTLRSKFDAVADCVRRLHTYQLPEITFVALAGGSAEYLAWIEEALGGPGSGSGPFSRLGGLPDQTKKAKSGS